MVCFLHQTCSQVECVRRIFERHPETALNLRPKNQLVKNAYMSTLLDLIDIACLAPQELTEEELVDAENTLLDLVGVGFELDWLKKKLEELFVKKKKMETRGERMRELDRMIVEQRQVLLALEYDSRTIMGKQARKKITWTIKNFSSLKCEKLCSDQFVVARCKWRLCAYPKGNNVDYLFLFLEVADHDSLPCGWRRNARYSLCIVNQNTIKRSTQNDEQKWFDEKSPRWGRVSMFPLNEIHAKESGYLVNGELKIVAEIEVIAVLGKLDVTEESSTIIETMDVNGFQLLPSQMELVSRLLERHPEIASNFRTKNPNLRTGYMSLLLSLIETLRQSPHELSKTDLDEADAALGSMTNAGFKLDWLEKKLDEMAEKKEKEEASEIRVQEIEEELKDLKQKCSDLEAQLEKEKLELSIAIAPISFDDVIM
ncbi:unnamed protein product [Eruca vesicaria subsp. sativa]|uniref:MATH domain-containing protein n=1 Tax=Eruca vesicaria subsp. sativa TaxID=29727 RepID=A0ABC8JC19_ERUVS|nr:unnamed protein product [Eruca vesicaria subsp. sativa]